jgi:hypothetical protein
MKKTIFLFSFLMASVLGVILAQSSALPLVITPAVTSVTANNTNTTAGTVTSIPNTSLPVRIWVSANGVQATTNGTLIVKFSTASGTYSSTNQFDTASESAVKVTLTTLGSATNSASSALYTGSDWFQLAGVRYIRVGQIENNFAGVVSNVTIRLGYQQ